MPRLILASQSPRRREVLGFFGLPFEQDSPPFDESSIPFDFDPEAYACTLAQCKAASLQEKYPEDVILAADTVVFREGKVYGKPRTIEEAVQFLEELSGDWHSVYTGVSVRYKDEEYHQAEVTRVLFNEVAEPQIQEYLRSIPWSDKAGGYAIQSAGGLIIRRIEGCFYNVLGLPLNTVQTLLKRTGIDLWQFLK